MEKAVTSDVYIKKEKGPSYSTATTKSPLSEVPPEAYCREIVYKNIRNG